MSILILILGILFLAGLTKIVNMYYNFYHIYKDLDNEERIRYFYNNIIVKLISNRNKTKKIFIYYILIPLIKINYLILSFLISLMHSLCELELDNFMKKNGFSIQECSHHEIDKILNYNENDENDDELSIFNEINEINDTSQNLSNLNIQICTVKKSSLEENNYGEDENKNILSNHNIENLIDEKLEFLINNQNNLNIFKNDEILISSELYDFNNFSLNNDNKNNEKLENFIKNKNCTSCIDDENKATNIMELMNDIEPTNITNLVKFNLKNNILKNDDNNELLKIDDNNEVLKIDDNNEVLKINDNNEVLKIDDNNELLKIDDIDFGENLNNFINNYNEEKKKITSETNTEVLIIKTGKKKNKI